MVLGMGGVGCPWPVRMDILHSRFLFCLSDSSHGLEARGTPCGVAFSGGNVVLIKKGLHFVYSEVGEEEFPVGQGGRGALAGEVFHFLIHRWIGIHVDFLKLKTILFEVGDCIDAPRTAGFDIDFENGFFGHGKRSGITLDLQAERLRILFPEAGR